MTPVLPHAALALAQAIVAMFLMLAHHWHAARALPYHHLLRELRRVVGRLAFRISGGGL
jgi:hypothetical protein